ncbi:MAG: hypothetical protein ACJATN_002440 [Neolewinella sp.]|jgi:hypothetical protein
MKALNQRLKTALGQLDASLPQVLSPQGVSEEMIQALEGKIKKNYPLISSVSTGFVTAKFLTTPIS